MTRSRSLRKLAGDSSSCPPATEKAPCNTNTCPTPCKVSAWSNWTSCSAVCGKGTQIRTRTVTKAATNFGECQALYGSQTCEATKLSDGSKCAKAVIDILSGTWNSSMASSQYKVCAGAEIDNPNLYAKFKDCNLVAGNIRIFAHKTGDFATLARAFDSVIAVAGQITFHDTAITSIPKAIFPKLEAVSKDIVFTLNKFMTSIEGFTALHSVGGALRIKANGKLKVAQFVSLTNVRGTFETDYEAALTELALPKLAYANSFWSKASGPTALNLPSLRTTLGFTLFVAWYQGNSMIASISIPALVSVGYIKLDAERLQFFSAPVLRAIQGQAYFYSNEKLKSISMPKLVSIKGKSLGRVSWRSSPRR